MEKLEIKFNKSKNPLAKSRFFDVEPKERPSNNARTFGTLIESVVGNLSLANLLN